MPGRSIDGHEGVGFHVSNKTARPAAAAHTQAVAAGPLYLVLVLLLYHRHNVNVDAR